MNIEVLVEVGNALNYQADVLILKYAQGLYGVDRAVVNVLSKYDDDITASLPSVGECTIVKSRGVLGSKRVLFVGVTLLQLFAYQQIREFARRALAELSDQQSITHVCVTVHGVNTGLDEYEAFESEIAGFVDAISSGKFPKSLERITIIEQNENRAYRLKKALSSLLPQGHIRIDSEGVMARIDDNASERLRSAGYISNSKPIVFVAMPFDEKMDDVFHYGIQGAVNAAGFLCERSDLSSFTGDVMERVKNRIRNANLVIADLTSANPNVYLEVGYAWGCGTPTVLLVQDTTDLKFDVRGQKCLVYSKIKDLEDALAHELENLRQQIV